MAKTLGQNDRKQDEGAGAAPAPVQAVQEMFAGYSDEDVPLGSYAGLLAVFLGAFVGVAVLAEHTDKRLPKRPRWDDLALFGIATHKLSRIVTRSGPTRAIRAPFTEYEGKSDVPSEVDENPRGEGAQRAIGELITCPWCVAPWIASMFAFGRVLWPRPTRLFASIFATTALSDFLQLIYGILRKRAN